MNNQPFGNQMKPFTAVKNLVSSSLEKKLWLLWNSLNG